MAEAPLLLLPEAERDAREKVALWDRRPDSTAPLTDRQTDSVLELQAAAENLPVPAEVRRGAGAGCVSAALAALAAPGFAALRRGCRSAGSGALPGLSGLAAPDPWWCTGRGRAVGACGDPGSCGPLLGLGCGRRCRCCRLTTLMNASAALFLGPRGLGVTDA